MEEIASFGYWLRRRRKTLDLSQVELAHQVGCAVDTIKKIEADQRRPSKQMAERLAEMLQIAPGERTAFLQTARAESATARLPLPAQSFISPPAPTGPPVPSGAKTKLPTFLTQAPKRAGSEGSVFVGREREMAALDSHLALALAGQGRVVFVTGEAGRGKTALLRAYAARAQALHPTLLVARGNCTAYAGVGDPYLPFRDVLSLLSGDIAAQWTAGLLLPEEAQRLWQAAPYSLQALFENGLDLIDVFVSSQSLRQNVEIHLTTAAEKVTHLLDEIRQWRLHPQPFEQHQLFTQYTELLRAVASQQPVLILIDDLQWADLASIKLLFHLGRQLAGSPLMIVASYRPSEIHLSYSTPSGQPHPLKSVIGELVRQFGEIQIDLEQTQANEERQFVDALLDSEPNRLTEQFRTALFTRARGHPLFTLELLRTLQERGLLIHNDQGQWVEHGALAWDTLPIRVEAVIQQRIDRLDATLREIITVAAVEGEEFTAQVIGRVLGLDERQLLQLLSSELVQRHRLIQPRGEVMVDERYLLRYHFGHVLFQQYVYYWLSPGERRLLHGKIAATLEELYGEQSDEIAVRLAYHYAQADPGTSEGKRAAHYLLRAGDKARAVYAHKEAADHYHRALAFMRRQGDEEGIARTLMKLGLTYHQDFDTEHARQVYSEGFTLWRRLEEGELADSLPPAPHALRLTWLEPATLDPVLGGTNLSAPIITQLFSGLVGQGPDVEVVPDVAESWEMLEGGRRYIFHLRSDVFWSDGVPVTSADFVFAFMRALDPATAAPVAGMLLHCIKGAEAYNKGKSDDASQIGLYAADAMTLVIELEEPTSYFLEQLSYYVLVPVPQHVAALHGAAWAQPEHIVTNGPFLLAKWQPGQTMVLERNPAYHGRFTGNVQTVELALNQNVADQIELFESDHLDVVYDFTFASFEIDRLRRRYPDLYSVRPRFATMYLLFHPDRPPFDDARVRRAFVMALNRETLTSVISIGYELPGTGGFVPPGMPGHVAGAGLPFDPQQARQLLAEVGYPGGHSFPLITWAAGVTRRMMAEYLQAQWQEHLGIKTSLQFYSPGGSALTLFQSSSFVLGGWWADYLDPENFLRVCVKMDVPKWQNVEYERLLEQAKQSMDQSQRLQYYQQADRILMEEAMLVPLTYARQHIVRKPWVRTFPTSPIKNPGFWKDVIIDPH